MTNTLPPPEALAEAVARMVRAALAPVLLRLAALDPVAQDVSVLRSELAGVRERLAALDATRAVPGPPGPAGPPGADGKDGKDGRDGLDGINGKDGAPGLRYAGVFQDGQAYELGDVVTWAGSAWHCQAATKNGKPGTNTDAWRLMVKAGRDGRDREAAH